MRAGGTSFARFAAPVLCVSLVVSLVSFVVNETIVAWSNAESRAIMVEEVRGGTLPTVTRHVVIKGERGNTWTGSSMPTATTIAPVPFTRPPWSI